MFDLFLLNYFKKIRFLKYSIVSLILFNVTACYATESYNPQQNSGFNLPYIVVDAKSGDIFAQNRSFDIWYPASITKLMTTYLAFKAMSENKLTKYSQVKLSRYDVSQAPCCSGYPAGTILSLEAALKIMLVKSTNDVATAIGELIAGSNSQFVKMMNAQAKEIGMNYTNFTSANGLPNVNNYSNARDLALLAIRLRQDFPEYDNYFNIQALDFAGFVGKTNTIIANSNNLLGRFEGIDGMKTGFVCASGYNLVASATREGKTIIAVVLGAKRLDIREELTAKLLEQAFNNKKENLPNIYNLKEPKFFHHSAINMRSQICTPTAAKARLNFLDKNFRPILHSPYIKPPIENYNIVQVKPIFFPTGSNKKNKKPAAS